MFAACVASPRRTHKPRRNFGSRTVVSADHIFSKGVQAMKLRAMICKYNQCSCQGESVVKEQGATTQIDKEQSSIAHTEADGNVVSYLTELSCDLVSDWSSSNETGSLASGGSEDSSCSTIHSLNDLSYDIDGSESGTELDLGGLPSVGSIGHADGNCQPCFFFRRGVCLVGRSCMFCHFHAGESLATFRARIAEANQLTASKTSSATQRVSL